MSVPEIWPDYFNSSTRSPMRRSAISGRPSQSPHRSAVPKSLEARPGSRLPERLDSSYGNLCADVEFPRRSHLPSHREVRRARVSDRAPLVVVVRGLRELADCAGPLRRALDSPHLGPGPGGRQLLRRGHRLHRGAGQRPAAAQQPPADLRRLGPHRLRTQRLHHRARRPLSADRSLPPGGTVCPANPNPFMTVANREKRRGCWSGCRHQNPGIAEKGRPNSNPIADGHRENSPAPMAR